MAERSVTVEGRVHRLPDPFLVIATQNPLEQEASLPESNLDRFLFKIYIDYTDYEHEVDMLRLPHTGGPGHARRDHAAARDRRPGTRRARPSLDATVVPDVESPATRLQPGKTRTIDGIMLGASSRAAIHLMSATKANARLEGRDTVTIQDVRDMAHYVLPHRLICEDEDHARGRAADGPRRPRSPADGGGGRPPHTWPYI